MSASDTAATEHAGHVTPEAIMQLGTAFWASKTLLSAVELGVFSELAGGEPQDGEALRERLARSGDLLDAQTEADVDVRCRRNRSRAGSDRGARHGHRRIGSRRAVVEPGQDVGVKVDQRGAGAVAAAASTSPAP
jgi:hypothetical protein